MAKGGAYERAVAKRLSCWLNGGPQEPIQLWRSTLSGGWAARDTTDVGDLAPKEEKGREFRTHFGVECKHWNDISLWGIFSHSTPKIQEWWTKLSQECYEHKICPLLIMKKDRFPELVGFPLGMFHEDMFTRIIDLPHLGLTLIMLEEFLTLKIDYVYNLCEQWQASYY